MRASLDESFGSHMRAGKQASSMRLGTYNVENLFMRARALNLASWADLKVTLTGDVLAEQCAEVSV